MIMIVGVQRSSPLLSMVILEEEKINNHAK
jgi:hypothetical protein